MSAPRPRGASGVTYAHAEEGYFDKRGLTRAAGFWGLWGLGVAAVISGDFSGWNFGIGGEPGEISAVAWLDASGYVLFRNGRRCSGRVALEGLECGQRLVARPRGHLQAPRSAAESRPGHAEARVEWRDHPVRSQGQDRTGRAESLRAKAGCRALGSDAGCPLVAAIGASGSHMQRLHRGDDPQLGETGHVTFVHQLDVLDAMMNAHGVTGRFVRVERSLHATVSNRVGDALKSGAGKQCDGCRIALWLGPEGV